MAWFLTEPLLLLLYPKPIRMKIPLPAQNKVKCYGIAFLTVLNLCLFSCKKDEVGSEKKVTGEAKIKVINATPSSSVDFFLDNSKVNGDLLLYGVDQEYVKIHSGQVSASISKDGVVGATIDFNFIPTLSYTSFYVEDSAGVGSILTLEDNFGATAVGMARIRIINLSPFFTNAVSVSTSSDLMLTSLAFKEFSNNFSFNPDVDVRFSILGTSVVKTMLASEFEAGKTYTIWIGGTSNASLKINKITYN